MGVMLSFLLQFFLLVIFVFVKPCILRVYAFRTRASIVTASCFIDSFGFLKNSM